MSMNSHPDLRHVPVAVSLAPDKKSQAVLDLVAVASEAGRPFVAPPGVSGQRVHLLREALKRVVQDPAFKEEAAKMMVEPALVEGIALQIGMRRVLEAPAEAVARLKEVLQ
jgi:tripartite-type tricarboxylate transporter receptor subunit TctC